MPLSNEDIKRINKLGFDTDFFVSEKNGWLQLKNQNGRCVFHDGKICTIYEHRPNGCRIYPIIFDKDVNHAVFDKECPNRVKFVITDDIKKKLNDQVLILERERAKRTKLKY